MTEEVWSSIRPHLDKVIGIDLSGAGEPLLQPRLMTWIAQAKHNGCVTGFSTNATLLDPGIARGLLDAGLDWLSVSMDGADAETYEAIRVGANFKKVCHNVKTFSNSRTNPNPKIMITFVIMSRNCRQLEEMVKLTADLGVDQINFKHCDVIRGEHGKNLGVFNKKSSISKDVEKFLHKALLLAKNLNVKATAYPFIPEELCVCGQDPRHSMFIGYDGTVGPCINLIYNGETTFLGETGVLPHVSYGNIQETDLDSLWDSEASLLYRRTFVSRCKAYENACMDCVYRGSIQSEERLLLTAISSMPAPPHGCEICHYLYGV